MDNYQKAAPGESNQMEQHMLQGQEWKLFDDDQLIGALVVRKAENGSGYSGSFRQIPPEDRISGSGRKWQLKFCILTRNRGPHRITSI